MKKDQIPQDKSALEAARIRELCYALNEEGRYETGLSKGWQPKAEALDLAWEEVERRKEEALEKVRNGKASPILYFMEARLMTISILAAYTGFWKWRIRRHMKPRVFGKLSDAKLKKYAKAFEVEPDAIRNFNPEDGHTLLST